MAAAPQNPARRAEPQGAERALKDTGLVFTWQDGRAHHPEHLPQAFDRLIKKLNLPPVRLHGACSALAVGWLIIDPAVGMCPSGPGPGAASTEDGGRERVCVVKCGPLITPTAGSVSSDGHTARTF
ncbi:hypothetical protein Shyhy02_09440 [Streptomyces hygroscopicus subsp. hygroscopicus]|nr:hypothetical protein Shyhy02_09440 [Streptomyces hygroscopicus subsp. hygroscopicus]